MTRLAILALVPALHAASLFPANAVPRTLTDADAQSVELGVRFSVSVPGTLTAARIYCSPQSSGTHTITLWSAAKAKIATATMPKCSGWTTVALSPMMALPAGNYTLSYHSVRYPVTENYFTKAITTGPLSTPVNAGVYAYGTSTAFPSLTYASSNYWVDLVFTPSAPHEVDLTWTKSTSPDIAGYTVWRSNTPGGPYTALTSTIQATSFTHTTVLPGQQYFYVATATDTNGEMSIKSNQATATVPTP